VRVVCVECLARQIDDGRRGAKRIRSPFDLSPADGKETLDNAVCLVA
jgi:hypothetical protein